MRGYLRLLSLETCQHLFIFDFYFTHSLQKRSNSAPKSRSKLTVRKLDNFSYTMIVCVCDVHDKLSCCIWVCLGACRIVRIATCFCSVCVNCDSRWRPKLSEMDTAVKYNSILLDRRFQTPTKLTLRQNIQGIHTGRQIQSSMLKKNATRLLCRRLS